jgi:ABC-type glycerol-3-phosphate transport system permease component
MAIISQIGRKHPAVRALLGTIYLVLALGAVTMVYPFLIMLSGSMKSAVDIRDFDVVPAFLRDDAMLYRKHMEGLFNESLDAMNSAYDTDYASFEAVRPPENHRPALAAEWRAFLEQTPLPDYARAGGYMAANVTRTVPGGLREFKRFLAGKHGESIDEVNRALGTDFVGWNAFFVIAEDYLPRVRMPQETAFAAALGEFKSGRSCPGVYHFSPEGYFKRQFLKAAYSKDIAEYNRAHGTSYASYREVQLSRRVPEGTPREQEDWERFVRENLNLLWVRADAAARPAYEQFLRAKYREIDVLNRNYGTDYASFGDVPLVGEPPFEGLALSDWAAVVSGWRDPDTGREHVIPAGHLAIHSVDFLFRDWLVAKHGTVARLNAALGTTFSDIEQVIPPQEDAHYEAFLASRGALRWEFATRNYKAVLDYVVFHGRGIVNTAVYCSLAVFFALLINPLAAYALSRYRMPSTYKVLLFLMLTMAFPAMVTQIPVFLMLRKLNLLNTFAALILPGLANGYSIFLLKGFFDSLPRELYESASIDGAGEWTMFWNITMSLSTPILSVIALQAFTGAYANFMYALLICQDEKMWTLMVWLYQLQERSGQAVMYASLLVAAIPTFAIFILCQKVIMRGIVVPVEK